MRRFQVFRCQRRDAAGDGAESTPSPAALIKRPGTAANLASNLVYIVKRDLAFRRDFYSDKSLERLLGASGTQGERGASEVALTAQLFVKAETSGGNGPLPWIASALLRRGSDGRASIHVQINTPSERAPYESVQRILGTAWQRWHSDMPTPHRRYVAPNAPHGNDEMVLRIGSPLADYVIRADFDSDALLHDFFVTITPIAGRSPS
jgi:hypothetical protein